MAPDALGLLSDGAAEIVPEGGLAQKLALKRPLRVKLGVDPSRPDLTLGHAVVLRKLRQFQDAGHVAVLIIGDFTARIGDPSGQSETRIMLSAEEVDANARTYLEQAGHVIDVERAEIHGNAEWSAPMDMAELLRLASVATVAQMLEREDFRARYQGGKPISVVEFLYPLFQGYDSVAVRADVELGGTDQTFNLLMGREVQRAYGLEPQVVLTVPLLEGTDGVRKMSKSFGNYVGITEVPDEMFGKLMSIPDDLTIRYLRLCTLLDPAEVDRLGAGLADGSLHPGEEKRRMARLVVDLYHGPGAGDDAEAHFNRLHRDRRMETEEAAGHWVPRAEVLVDGQIDVGALLFFLQLARSRSEGRRLVRQAAVRCLWPDSTDESGERISEERLAWSLPLGHAWEGSVWSVGRRRFARLLGFSDD